jgi:hypothetical protein
MNEIKAVLWTGGDAPDRNATLTVNPDWGGGFHAFWEPGFCGCEDCHPCYGRGATEAEAIADYWEQWEEKYGEPQ